MLKYNATQFRSDKKEMKMKLFQRLLPILRYSQELQDQNEHIH